MQCKMSQRRHAHAENVNCKHTTVLPLNMKIIFDKHVNKKVLRLSHKQFVTRDHKRLNVTRCHACHPKQHVTSAKTSKYDNCCSVHQQNSHMGIHDHPPRTGKLSRVFTMTYTSTLVPRKTKLAIKPLKKDHVRSPMTYACHKFECNCGYVRPAMGNHIVHRSPTSLGGSSHQMPWSWYEQWPWRWCQRLVSKGVLI